MCGPGAAPASGAAGPPGALWACDAASVSTCTPFQNAEDCLLTMPPAPMAYRGGDAIGSFFATVPAAGDLTAIRLGPHPGQRAARPSRQPARRPIARAYGIMVLTIHAGLIREITGFAEPSLFPLFGLPQQAGWPHGQAS